LILTRGAFLELATIIEVILVSVSTVLEVASGSVLIIVLILAAGGFII